MRWVVPVAAAACLVVLAAAAPPWVDQVPGSFLGLLSAQWLLLAIWVVVSLAVAEMARLVARSLMRLRSARADSTSRPAERSVCRGAGLVGFALPWYLALGGIELGPLATHRLTLVVEAITIVGTMLLVYGIWDAVCDAIAERSGGVANAEKLLVPVTRKLVRFLILLAGVLLALGVMGVNITGLLAGVGIGGLVVALAAKDSVENVFGSLTILFDMPFALGDWVKIDKVEGIVEEINLRSTRIRTFEDSIITLPNSNLIKAAVENYGARRYRRQRFQVRISYASRAANIARFIEQIRSYLEKIAEVIGDRTVVELNDMTEASAGVLVQCFFEAESFREEARLRGELMLAIFSAAEATGVILINTPIPVQPEEPEISEEERKQILDKEDII